MSDNTPEMQALIDTLASDHSQTLHDLAEHHMLVFRWLLEGYEITVFDGVGYSLARSQNLADLINEIEGVEEAEIFARMHGSVKTHAWALITPFGVAHDETVADHSTEPWMCKLMAEIASSYYGD